MSETANPKQREARFLEISREHPDWPQARVNVMVREELGAGVNPKAIKRLSAKARGLKPGSQGKRATWSKALAKASRAGAKASVPPAPPPSPPPSPASTTRTRRQPPSGHPRINGSAIPTAPTASTPEEQILAAVQLLVEAVPGIRTVTIEEDGAVNYTTREVQVVERRGSLRL